MVHLSSCLVCLAASFKTRLAFIIFSAGGGCFVFCLAFAKACSHSLMMTWDDRMMTFWHGQLPSLSREHQKTDRYLSCLRFNFANRFIKQRSSLFFPSVHESNVSMQMLGTLDNMCNSSSKHKFPTELFFFQLDGINRQKTPHLRRYVSN